MTAPSRAAFAPHDVVGGYELIHRAGKGGMAEVWQARRTGGRGRPVAIKVILPHLAGQERYGRMFRAEAEVSSRMSHSNIVQVFDEGDEGGISYLVMEWVEGINLVRLREALKLIGNPDLRTSMVAFVIGQLLHALGYAHSLTDDDGSALGVVHRDISPQNVLVSAAGDVKLLDFGVAHTVVEESSGLHVKGKLRYMAPEQLTSRVKAPTLDLFGVGALLHELLEGQRFRGDFKDDRQLHAQVMRGIVPALRVPVAPELERLRQALLAADPVHRVPSAGGALELLRQYRGYRDRRVELSKIVGSLLGAAPPSPAAPSAPAAAPPGPAAFAPPPPVAPLAPHPGGGSAGPAATTGPAATLFLDGGGLPPGARQGPAPRPEPVAAPTAFLPSPQAGMPTDEATAFVAPPSALGFPPPASAPGPSTAQPLPPARPGPPPRAAAAVVRGPSPEVDDYSMTRFVVDQRSPARTILLFVTGLVLALAAAGAAAWFILDDGDPGPETSTAQ